MKKEPKKEKIKTNSEFELSDTDFCQAKIISIKRIIEI